MGPGHDPMGAPTSFTARRPNASHLPAFELPPPPMSTYQQHHHQHQQQQQQQKSYGYSHLHQSQHSPATTLTSVGNLLTPPGHGSTDGLSPAVSNSTHPSLPTYTSNGAMWPPTTSTNPSYGFHASGPAPQYSQGRGLFSPSLNSIVRGSSSPTAGDALQPSSYEMNHYTSSSMPTQQQMMPVSAQTQPSPIPSQDAFSRPPPTPTSYYSHPSSTPQQTSFPYQNGPSPVVQSPMSANGSIGKMSPINPQGHIPSLHQQQHQYAQHRPYSYQMPGPVLSNMHNSGMVGAGVQAGMIRHFNSGHAAQMHHLYGHHAPNPQNDRPFRCDQCPQSFNRNHDLKRHKRIHLAVKPFPCGHCDKSFSRKDALKRHVLVKGCGKASAQSDIKEIDGSLSPDAKSDSMEHSPIPATA